MYNRLLEFAETNQISFFRQFCVRKNYSSSHAFIHLLNKISSAIDQHETTIGIFLDLSKAFDTIDHEILFTKLEHHGIHDAAL